VTASLAEVEAELEAHFVRVTEDKKSKGDGHSVFALEHGLTPATVGQLGSMLGKSLASLRYMSPKHRLTWVVHAAERGYTFQGLEYWDSFAQVTPNWYTHGSKDTLRSYFSHFAKTYRGVRPSGRWAKHYAYICWPITNALLPKDLQIQLAQAVYNLRHKLDRVVHLTDADLGRMVGQHAYDPTSRFSFFLQQEDLVGWIVRALLRGGDAASTTIERRTLQRLIDDVRTHSHTKAWLSEVQRIYAKYTTHVRAHSAPTLAGASPQARPVQGPAGPDLMGTLVPRLSLRRAAGDTWNVLLHVPSFHSLVATNPQFAEHLDRTRVRIPCHSSAMSPGMALLSGQGLTRTVKAWPIERKCLLEFDKTLSAFDGVVVPECQLRPSTKWLFKIKDDGTGSHVVGTAIRPGQTYVAIARDISRIQMLGSPAALTCTGVSAVWFKVPDPVSPAVAARLQQAGLSATYTVTVEPVGATPRRWDGQSLGEWLTTETPCFAVRRDHDFDEYHVSVNGMLSQAVACGSGVTNMVAIKGLPTGRHAVELRTYFKAGRCGPNPDGFQRSTSLFINVREPSTWTPGRLSVAAMVVECMPAGASLHELVQGRVWLTVEGDRARTVTVTLSLLDASGLEVKSMLVCSQRLPLTRDNWKAAASRLFDIGTDDLDLLAVAGANLIVDGQDLGERRLTLRHSPEPVRWLFKKSKSSATLRLINDSENLSVTVRRFAFASPMNGLERSADYGTTGIDVGRTDGLFIADAGELGDAVIVSPRNSGHGLDWLRVKFESGALTDDFGQLIVSYDKWSGARVCGALSRFRQRRVLTALHRHVLELVVGNHWCSLEASVEQQADDHTWLALEDAVLPRCHYGIALGRKWVVGGIASESELEAAFLEVTQASRVGATVDVWRCAWRLSEGLNELTAQDKQRIASEVDIVLPGLVRGARLLRLCQSTQRPRQVSP
jgi:hypothetical protein